MTKHTFRAYNSHGRLIISSHTTTPATYAVEVADYQARLNRNELFWVTVISDDPHEAARTMWPARQPKERQRK